MSEHWTPYDKSVEVKMLNSDATVNVLLDWDGWIRLHIDGRGYDFRTLGMDPKEARELAAALTSLADEAVP